jgi:glutamate dehydrogenase
VEVNIKIAFRKALEDGKITLEQRNKTLEEMTDNVAELVLRNNYLQTLALSLTERKGMEDFSFQSRLMKDLAAKGLLDRVVEFLPDDMTMQAQAEAGEPLTRPELAVLLSYAKITLFNNLLEGDVLDDAYWHEELVRYFPDLMQGKFLPEIESHRLRKEIIATQLSNSMINRAGATLVTRIAGQTGASIAALTGAYAVARDAFNMRGLNGQIDALDTKIDGGLQIELYGQLQDLLLQLMMWFVRNADFAKGISPVVSHYSDNVQALKAALPNVVSKGLADWMIERAANLQDKGVPNDLASDMARLPLLAYAPDIITIADSTKAKLPEAAEVFFAVGERFDLNAVDRGASKLSLTDYYDRLALNQALGTLARARFDLSCRIVQEVGHDKAAVVGWMQKMGTDAQRLETSLKDIAANEHPSLSQVAVAANLLADLVRLRG